MSARIQLQGGRGFVLGAEEGRLISYLDPMVASSGDRSPLVGRATHNFLRVTNQSMLHAMLIVPCRMAHAWSMPGRFAN